MSQLLVAPATETPQGGEIAFEALYSSSRDDVYAYAAGLLRDRAAAEDVTATAFERAYRKRSRFDPRRGSPRAWLFGIVRNAALDELRRRGRQAAGWQCGAVQHHTAGRLVKPCQLRLVERRRQHCHGV